MSLRHPTGATVSDESGTDPEDEQKIKTLESEVETLTEHVQALEAKRR